MQEEKEEEPRGRGGRGRGGVGGIARGSAGGEGGGANLCINKSFFNHKDIHKKIWVSPYKGYNQADIDHLFASIVLPKITYGLSVYAASSPELTTVQNFLRRCHKRKYISYAIDVNELIDKSDRSIFNKIKKNCNHPLYEIMPKIKQTSLRLGNPTSLLPRIHTQRFKASYINRLYFKYKLLL